MTNLFTDVTSLLTVFFRNSVTDPVQGRGDDYVDSFIGNGVNSTFTTTKKAVSNVKSVKVDGLELYHIKDYNVSYGWSTQYTQIILNRAPKADAVIEIDYHTGQHFVFPGWVIANIKPSMPRIGFSQLGGNPESVGVGQYVGTIKEEVIETFSSTGQKNFSFSSTPSLEINEVVVEHSTPMSEPEHFLSDGEGIYFREEIPVGENNVFVKHKINIDKGTRKAVRYKLKYQVDVWAQNPRFRDDLISQMVEAISNPFNRRKLRNMGFLDVELAETPQDLSVDDSGKEKSTQLFRKIFEFHVTIETYYDELEDKIKEVQITPLVQS